MDYDTLDKEIEFFKENGVVTETSKQKWLELKGVIRIEHKQVIVIADKNTDKTSCKNYEKHCQLLEMYLKENEARKLGKMGTKSTEIITNQIDAESIPF